MWQVDLGLARNIRLGSMDMQIRWDLLKITCITLF